MFHFDYNKYETQYNNHSHFLYGFFDILTNNEYLIKNFNLTNKKDKIQKISIMCSECPEDLKIYMIPQITKHVKKNVLIDENITVPTTFDVKNINDFDIIVTMTVKNIKKEIYDKKIQLYSTQDAPYKSYKYTHKSKNIINKINERYNATHQPILLYGGGKLLYQISDDVCNGLSPTQYTHIVTYYSEPYINLIYGLITQILYIYTGTKYDFYNQFTYAPADTFYSTIDYFTPTFFAKYFGRIATQIDYEDQRTYFLEQYNNLFDEIKLQLDTEISHNPDSEMLLNMKKIITDGLITDATLRDGSWKKNMMFKHLEMHKYAHNGVNNLSTINVDGSEITILDFVKENLVINDDWNVFHFVHSLLHAYDALYMKNIASFNGDYEIINNTTTLMPEQQAECLKKTINKYALDFLAKDADGKLLLPLTIIDDAVKDKKRQYGDSKTIPELLSDLKPQVSGSSPLPTTGTTTEHPNRNSIP